MRGYLIGVLGALWIMTVIVAFFAGRDYERSKIAEARFNELTKTQQDGIDLQINTEAIASSIAASTAVALNQEAKSAGSSVRIIYETPVSEHCRDVDPVILRELQSASSAANDTLRNGLRSIAAGTDPGNPLDPP